MDTQEYYNQSRKRYEKSEKEKNKFYQDIESKYYQYELVNDNTNFNNNYQKIMEYYMLKNCYQDVQINKSLQQQLNNFNN